MQDEQLNKIFKNGPSDIQERIDTIDETIKRLIDIQNEVKKRGKYCSYCHRWYYEKDCPLGIKEVMRTVCTNPMEGYLNDYEYETVIDKVIIDHCPEGHEIDGNKDYSFSLY